MLLRSIREDTTDMSNPVEDYLEEKTAINWDNWRRVAGETGQKTIIGAGASAAIAGIGLAAHKIYDAATKSRDFHSMLRENPDIAEHHELDPHRVNLYYSSLRTMNSDFSKDPVVAGTYMRRMMENQPTAGSVSVEALSHQDKLPNPLMEAFTQGGLRGVQEGSKYRPAEFEEGLASREYEQQLRSHADAFSRHDERDWESKKPIRNDREGNPMPGAPSPGTFNAPQGMPSQFMQRLGRK